MGKVVEEAAAEEPEVAPEGSPVREDCGLRGAVCGAERLPFLAAARDLAAVIAADSESEGKLAGEGVGGADSEVRTAGSSAQSGRKIDHRVA